jgi:ankyrin repeat protein
MHFNDADRISLAIGGDLGRVLQILNSYRVKHRDRGYIDTRTGRYNLGGIFTYSTPNPIQGVRAMENKVIKPLEAVIHNFAELYSQQTNFDRRSRTWLGVSERVNLLVNTRNTFKDNLNMFYFNNRRNYSREECEIFEEAVEAANNRIENLIQHTYRQFKIINEIEPAQRKSALKAATIEVSPQEPAARHEEISMEKVARISDQQVDTKFEELRGHIKNTYPDVDMSPYSTFKEFQDVCNPIHFAIEKEDAVLFRHLLSQNGIEVDKVDENDMTPLTTLCQGVSVKEGLSVFTDKMRFMVTRLIAKGASLTVKPKNLNTCPLLQMIIKNLYSQDEIYEWIRKCINKDNATSYLSVLFYSKDERVVNHFIEVTGSVHCLTDQGNEYSTPLLRIVSQMPFTEDKIFELIKKCVNKENAASLTSILFQTKDERVIDYFLELGVSIDCMDEVGRTLLFIATDMLEVDRVKMLLRKGANPNAERPLTLKNNVPLQGPKNCIALVMGKCETTQIFLDLCNRNKAYADRFKEDTIKKLEMIKAIMDLFASAHFSGQSGH